MGGHSSTGEGCAVTVDAISPSQTGKTRRRSLGHPISPVRKDRGQLSILGKRDAGEVTDNAVPQDLHDTAKARLLEVQSHGVKLKAHCYGG